MMLKSPHSSIANNFYNWLHYMVKLKYGFTQSLLVDYAAYKNHLLLWVVLFHPVLDYFEQADVFPSHFLRSICGHIGECTPR